MNAGTTLITWLKDAQAMELGLIPVLQAHAHDARSYPELHRRELDRIELCRRRAALISACIARLECPDAAPGASDNAWGDAGREEGVPDSPGDQIIKNALMRYGAEHFEIACYRALLAAATAADEPAAARLCGDILREQQQQARTLDENLPELISRRLAQHAPQA